jgi:opacity protein-like surface antigen
MKRWLVLSSAACLVIVGTAAASVQTGDTELNFGGSLFSLNSGNQGGLNLSSWMLGGGLGYFTTDNIELGGVGILTENSERWNHDGTDTRMLKRDTHLYAFGGQAKYHFMPENQLVPYVGGQILWADVKVKETFNATPAANWERDKQGIVWGPIAGLRYSLNEQNDVFIEYQYLIYSSNIHDIIQDGHTVLLGLSHKFK